MIIHDLLGISWDILELEGIRMSLAKLSPRAVELRHLCGHGLDQIVAALLGQLTSLTLARITEDLVIIFYLVRGC